MKFNINNYKGEYVMHCKTEEETKIFSFYLDSIGKKIHDGRCYLTDTPWEVYKDKICYNFNLGLFGDKPFYEKFNYKFLEFSDFEWDEMIKPVFKIGDRVRCIDGLTNSNVTGKIGTVIANGNPHLTHYVLIEFDEYIDGHDGYCDAEGKPGHCWWVLDDKLILVKTKRKPVIIYKNGQEVIALDKETNKKAVAKCHPDDTFDFEIGAKLALDRLYHTYKVDDPRIGDRVRCVKSYQGNDKIVNKTGRIIEIDSSRKNVTVEFDELIDGHSGHSCCRGKSGHCWIVPVEYLVPETSGDYEINVGDYVKVVNNGRRYSTYTEWVTKNTPEYAAYYAYNNSTPLSDEFLKVVAKAPHSLEEKDKTLFLIKNEADGACYLFAEEGLRKA